MKFIDWLAVRHPEVRLTKLQTEWAEEHQKERDAMYESARASGKTFFLKLWIEYLHSQDQWIADRLEPKVCNRPPRGWYCKLPRNHTGPCPTWPRWWNIRGRWGH